MMDRRQFLVATAGAAAAAALPGIPAAIADTVRPWPAGAFFTGMTNYAARPDGHLALCFSDGAWVSNCDLRGVDVWLDGKLRVVGNCRFDAVRGPGHLCWETP